LFGNDDMARGGVLAVSGRRNQACLDVFTCHGRYIPIDSFKIGNLRLDRRALFDPHNNDHVDGIQRYPLAYGTQ
jgi:hypothetical protein